MPEELPALVRSQLVHGIVLRCSWCLHRSVEKGDEALRGDGADQAPSVVDHERHFRRRPADGGHDLGEWRRSDVRRPAPSVLAGVVPRSAGAGRPGGRCDRALCSSMTPTTRSSRTTGRNWQPERSSSSHAAASPAWAAIAAGSRSTTSTARSSVSTTIRGRGRSVTSPVDTRPVRVGRGLTGPDAGDEGPPVTGEGVRCLLARERTDHRVPARRPRDRPAGHS